MSESSGPRQRLYTCLELMLENHTWPMAQLFPAMYCLWHHSGYRFAAEARIYSLISKHIAQLKIIEEREYLRSFVRQMVKHFPSYVPNACMKGVGVAGIIAFMEIPITPSALPHTRYVTALSYATGPLVSVGWLLEIHEAAHERVSLAVIIVIMVLHGVMKKDYRYVDKALRTLRRIERVLVMTESFADSTMFIDIRHEHLYNVALSHIERKIEDLDWDSPWIQTWNREIVRICLAKYP